MLRKCTEEEKEEDEDDEDEDEDEGAVKMREFQRVCGWICVRNDE